MRFFIQDTSNSFSKQLLPRPDTKKQKQKSSLSITTFAPKFVYWILKLFCCWCVRIQYVHFPPYVIYSRVTKEIQNEDAHIHVRTHQYKLRHAQCTHYKHKKYVTMNYIGMKGNLEKQKKTEHKKYADIHVSFRFSHISRMPSEKIDLKRINSYIFHFIQQSKRERERTKENLKKRLIE